MKQRIIAAAVLAILAGAAFAQQTPNPAGDFVIIKDGETPPSGYAPLVPSYKWENGRFVRDGQVYQSLHSSD